MDSKFSRFWDYAVAVLVATACFVPRLIAAGPASGTPEIDGNTITVGIGLLAAGVLIIRARRR